MARETAGPPTGPPSSEQPDPASEQPATADVLSGTDLAKWPIVAGSDVIAAGPGETYIARRAP